MHTEVVSEASLTTSSRPCMHVCEQALLPGLVQCMCMHWTRRAWQTARLQAETWGQACLPMIESKQIKRAYRVCVFSRPRFAGPTRTFTVPRLELGCDSICNPRLLLQSYATDGAQAPSPTDILCSCVHDRVVRDQLDQPL
jgi:hypothetical protein